MSCSVIIKDMRRECERRVYVDSEEELKNMNVEEFIRRACPDDERRRNCIYFIFKELEDDQTRGLRSTVTEYLNYDKTLGYYGIRKGSTIIEMDFSYVVTAPPADEDEDEGFSDHP